MSADRLLQWSDLLQKLTSLCAERRTGTLFIATDDNRLARFALKAGTIVAVVFQRKQGLDAIEMMQSVLAGTWKFNEQMMLVGATQSLPSTPDLLKMLADDSSIDLVLPTLKPVAPAPPASPPAAAPASRSPVEQWFPSVDISEVLQIKELISTGLIEIMGPMGKLVCDDHLSALTDRRSIVLAIDKVAEEIGDPELERQFKMSIAKKLQALEKGRRQ